MDRRQRLGMDGEDVAARHVTTLGWAILDRRWRGSRQGELDLVAEQRTGDGTSTVVFCEVKCRRGLGFGDPLESITYAKLSRLHGLALEWLNAHPVRYDKVRIDAIGILWPPGSAPQITHVRGLQA